MRRAGRLRLKLAARPPRVRPDCVLVKPPPALARLTAAAGGMTRCARIGPAPTMAQALLPAIAADKVAR
jgi:hypothetical protein